MYSFSVHRLSYRGVDGNESSADRIFAKLASGAHVRFLAGRPRHSAHGGKQTLKQRAGKPKQQKRDNQPDYQEANHFQTATFRPVRSARHSLSKSGRYFLPERGFLAAF